MTGIVPFMQFEGVSHPVSLVLQVAGQNWVAGIVDVGAIVMRRTQPDLPRAFRCPGVPYIPILAIISCGALILNLHSQTFIRFLIWLVIGLAVYFLYSRKNSLLNHDSEK